MGQQVLTLGLSTSTGFVPVDSELFVSAVKAQALHRPFRDGRNVAAQRYRIAQQQTKPQMARDLSGRAQRTGIDADYLLADAWFGTKSMIRLAEEACLTPILRMKKSRMKYRLTAFRQGAAIHRELDVKALYQSCIRKQWRRVPGQPYQAKAWDVELNLNASSQEPDHWIKVRLLFVRGAANADKAQPAKHDWADESYYELQRLKDNLSLFTPEILDRINQEVVRAGHQALKKSPDESLKARCDSFVVETDVHFPTDINLLWDAIRKTLQTCARWSKAHGLTEWRKKRPSPSPIQAALSPYS